VKDVRRALVTGASSGIGLALAKRLAARGVEVWLVARRAALLEEAVASVRARGGRAHAVVLDMVDGDVVFDVLSKLDETTGGFDLVIANAGVAGDRVIGEPQRMSWRQTKEIFDVNLVGAAATFSAFIPGMLRRGGGQLVGISSLAADIPLGTSAAYSASKAGLTCYLESLDIALRPLGVSVTAIHPGFVRTPAVDGLGPLPMMIETDRAVDLIERAIDRERRVVRFPWTLGFLLRGAAMMPAAIRNPLIRRAMATRRA
jgi:short-subunit dehydrogenase